MLLPITCGVNLHSDAKNSIDPSHPLGACIGLNVGVVAPSWLTVTRNLRLLITLALKKKSQAASVDHGFNLIRMICSDGCLIKNNCGPLLRLHLSDPFRRIMFRS